MPVDGVYAAYRVGAMAARALPGPAVGPAARVVGAAAASGAKGRRLTVERNLRRVSGGRLAGADLRRAVHQTFESYIRYWLESFRLPGTAPADLDRGMRTDGFDNVTRGLDAGNGVILALPHLGGWEWAAFHLTAVRRVPVAAVVEPLQPPKLAEWFVELRRALGMEIITLGPSAGSAVVRALRNNSIVCLLCDRDIAGGGVDVDFFGERTSLPAGPATLALRTGAPLLPSAVYYRGSMHHGLVRPPLHVERTGRLRDDVALVTQALADELEGLIREAPEQWHLMQPNWPSDREALDSRRSERRGMRRGRR